MAHRIEVSLKPGVRDARGERIKREIEHFLHLPISKVETIDVYTVDAPLTAAELESAAAGPFSDPVIQLWSMDKPAATTGFDFAVEVGFRPGVTDTVGRTPLCRRRRGLPCRTVPLLRDRVPRSG